MVKKNSIKAWILAARPKTLTGAAAPVLIGGALAWEEAVGFQLDRLFYIPFAVCLLFAFLMQIDANFVNDWWDFKKGTDREDRLGPERACAQGWITPKAMFVGIVLITIIACGVGLLLLFWRMQWELLIVGIACVLGCFLYTLKLSYLGLGDLLVLVFFGIVPVGFTYYVIMGGKWSLDVTLAGIGMGLITDCLLMVNNYRDREQDKISGKNTLVVRYGKRFGQIAYFSLAIVAASLMVIVDKGVHNMWAFAAIIICLAGYLYKEMCNLEGKALNALLGKTALMIFLYGLLFAIGIVW